MESVDFDTVKAEKAEAIRLYNRNRNSLLLLRFAALLALTFSASWLSCSGAVDLLRQSELYFNRPVYIFTLLNLIIAVIFFSSARKLPPTSSDIYDHDCAAVGSDHSRRIADDSTTEESSKQIFVPVDNAGIKCDIKTVTGTDAVSSDDSVTGDGVAPVSVSVKEKEKKKRCYGRSKSEYICREEMAVKEEPRRRSMDDLSSEEFRLKIEKFIAAKKKTLIRENTVEIIRG